MSWKKLSDFIGKKNIVLEIEEETRDDRDLEQTVLLFEYINKSEYLTTIRFKVFPHSWDVAVSTIDDFNVRVPSKDKIDKLMKQHQDHVLSDLANNLEYTFLTSTETELFTKGKKKVIKPDAEGCLESHLYRVQELLPYTKETSLRNKNGKFGKSKLIFHEALDKDQYKEAMKALDGILGVACVALLANYKQYLPKTSNTKAKAYGKVEYNVSNAWMMHPLISNIVIDLARDVVTLGANGYYKFWNASTKEVKDVLTKHNVKKARQILKRNKKVFIELLAASYDDDAAKKLFKVFMKGIHKNIKAPFNLKDNWLKDNEKYYSDFDEQYYNEEQDGEIADLQVRSSIDKISRGVKF